MDSVLKPDKEVRIKKYFSEKVKREKEGRCYGNYTGGLRGRI